jgi:hypothetical protein
MQTLTAPRHQRSKAPDLFKVREYNIRNRQPQTIVMFKLFANTTIKLINELFDHYPVFTDLPYSVMNLKTRVDFRDLGYGYFEPRECLVFCKVEGGDLPPRIQENNLWCLRKGVDSYLYSSALYDKVIRIGWSGKYIDKWNREKTKEKIKVLKKFF